MGRRKPPERTCVGCRTTRPKQELIRVVRTPEGDVVVDATGKRSGRGAYLCPDSGCLEAAAKGKRLERALMLPIPEEVVASLRAAL